MKRILTCAVSFTLAFALFAACGKDPGTGQGTDTQVRIPGVHAVDLGLSVKWADANVGAAAPSDYGFYYSWGEIAAKEDYTWDTYAWCEGSATTMTKYCTGQSYGKVDNLTALEAADDICTVAYGGKWRMPTEAEWKELQKECAWEKVLLDGAFAGYKVRAKEGDASIVIPVAGGWEGDSVHRAGYSGFYWASGLYEAKSCYARVFTVTNGSLGTTYGSRQFGLSVRAVLAE